jgi:hypothetical protein
VRITDACITARNSGKTNMRLLPGGVNIILEGFMMDEAINVVKEKWSFQGLVSMICREARFMRDIEDYLGLPHLIPSIETEKITVNILLNIHKAIDDSMDLLVKNNTKGE